MSDVGSNDRALVLFSGGLDSTTCLAMAVKEFGRDNVVALTIYYGQRHKREIEAARDVANYYGVDINEINLESVFEASDCSLLSGDIPDGSYQEQLAGGTPTTYVPFRNGVMLSIASAVALSLGCRFVYYGAHQDDASSVYPDCTPEFNAAMTAAVHAGTNAGVEVRAPFIHKRKRDIVAKGAELCVPYELTWSCYKGGKKACGCCGTCIDRLKAFRDNGLTDPIEYETERICE